MTEGGSHADRVRRHVILRYITPARDAGRRTATVRVGNVVRDCGLNNRAPAVCSALEAKKFRELACVQLLERRGPAQSTTTEFHYAILDEPVCDGHAPVRTDMKTARVVESPRPPANASGSGESASRDTGENRLYLVSCVKTKRNAPAKAKDLYCSDWFRKARTVVETTGHPWRILSALYGLVDPEEFIEPYEKTLKRLRTAERRKWAGKVLATLDPHLKDVDAVVFFAGKDYRKFLVPELRRRGLEVRVPMERLGWGEQLNWLNHRLHG